jgi:hypothetical protein
MRTAKYSDFLSRMQAFAGVESLLAVEEAHFLQYFNSNLRYIWENFEWPEICPTEQRYPDSFGVIELDNTGGTEIGEVFGVYDANPLLAAGANEVNWVLTADGIQLTGTDITSAVWVHFKKRCPVFSGAAYAGGTTYEEDDQAYYATTGKFYRAILETTGNVPTDTSYWEEVEIPYSFLEYVIRSSYADALSAEGFDEKASRQRGNAEAWLLQEIEKVSRQQRQSLRHGVIRTHGTTQYRSR